MCTVNKEIKKRSFAIDADPLPEFKKLIEDSRHSADYLLQTLNEGRKSLKEIAYALDEKELGGVFIWKLGLDDIDNSYPLMDCVATKCLSIEKNK